MQKCWAKTILLSQTSRFWLFFIQNLLYGAQVELLLGTCLSVLFSLVCFMVYDEHWWSYVTAACTITFLFHCYNTRGCFVLLFEFMMSFFHRLHCLSWQGMVVQCWCMLKLSNHPQKSGVCSQGSHVKIPVSTQDTMAPGLYLGNHALSFIFFVAQSLNLKPKKSLHESLKSWVNRVVIGSPAVDLGLGSLAPTRVWCIAT